MNPRELEKRRAAAVEAAQAAGRLVLGFFRRGIPGRVKGRLDVVTEADRHSERFLQRFLLERFPRDGFLGEEYGPAGAAHGGRNGSSRRYWAVDPLDGTINFLHGHPFFAVSVAFVDAAGPVVGVVEAPALGWSYAAARGGGATRNGGRLRVSSTRSLARSLVGTGWPPGGRAPLEPAVAPLPRLLGRTHGARRCGSAALDLALTAEGTYDGYFEGALNPWDVAAGILLVREAGGRVTDYAGREADVSGREVLASNGRIHEALRSIVARGGA